MVAARQPAVAVIPGSVPVRRIRKGAAESVAQFVKANGGGVDQKVMDKVDEISRLGATPLLVADRDKVLGIILLKDVVKGGIKDALPNYARWACARS